MKIKVIIPIILMGFYVSSCGVNDLNRLESPDKSLVLDIELDNGILSYSLKKDNKNNQTNLINYIICEFINLIHIFILFLVSLF